MQASPALAKAGPGPVGLAGAAGRVQRWGTGAVCGAMGAAMLMQVAREQEGEGRLYGQGGLQVGRAA